MLSRLTARISSVFIPLFIIITVGQSYIITVCGDKLIETDTDLITGR